MDKKNLFALTIFFIISIFFIGKTIASVNISISLNTTKVWWKDPVLSHGNLYSNGSPLSGKNVDVKLENETKCSAQSDVNGNWNCSFYSPDELGTYDVIAESEGATATTSLEIRPNYGLIPIGTTDRIAYETPFMVQDMNGGISQIWMRIMVWRK